LRSCESLEVSSVVCFGMQHLIGQGSVSLACLFELTNSSENPIVLRCYVQIRPLIAFQRWLHGVLYDTWINREILISTRRILEARGVALGPMAAKPLLTSAKRQPPLQERMRGSDAITRSPIQPSSDRRHPALDNASSHSHEHRPKLRSTSSPSI
jgi:hypothetical protein